MAGQVAVSAGRPERVRSRLPALAPAGWIGTYLRLAVATDCACALGAGALALALRFDSGRQAPAIYLAITLVLPVAWLATLALAGGYDSRLIGVGSDEFRKVINAGVSMTAVVVFAAYASKTDLARGYVVIALPCMTALGVLTRYLLRKRLHWRRSQGLCMRRVVAVGHAAMVADLTAEFRRDTYHGLQVVAACLASPSRTGEIAGVPAYDGLDQVSAVVRRLGADTVAVLACPEMSGVRLRELAWELEKTGTDLCVASALIDIAGPRTTIRPVAGLPLLHLDHPEFTGARRVVKAVFDRALAASILILTAPLFLVAAAAILAGDGGPVLFRQTRIGRDGLPFTVYKFRTMVADAEQRKDGLAAANEHDGVLFKIRGDPRITRVGRWLRRWSVDELPQLINVLLGDMSMVGPRPALPEEAARYGSYVRRRLVVKPGLTGLWQVSGRSDLSWDESVRLDLRYVENWSFMLDLQILWKTGSAVVSGSGAY